MRHPAVPFLNLLIPPTVVADSGSDNDSNMSDTKQTTPKSRETKETKYCGVCGDKALGYNFNAISCESCKAFFRRNALKNKEFTCPFENKCKVDVVTRRFCQKCRLKKCFEIGMKKEWIMTEEEKKVKREKIEENRRFKRSGGRSSTSVPKAKRLKALPTAPLSTNLVFFGGSDSTESAKPRAIVTGMPKQSLSLDSENGPTSVDSVSASDAADSQGLLSNDDTRQIASYEDTEDGDNSVENDEPERKPPKLSDGCHGSSPNNETSLKYKNSILAQELAAVQSPPPTLPVAPPITPSSSYNEGADLIPTDPMTPSTSSSFQDEVCMSVMQFASGISASSVESEELTIKQEKIENAEANKSTDGSEEEKDLKPPTGLAPFGKEAQEVINIEIAIRFAGVFMNSFISNRKELSMEERRKLDELTDANEVMKMPLTVGITDPSLLDVINLTDHAIRRLIKMSKKISGFKNLCQDCQIALLKGSCTELMILRSVMSYVPEEECWQGPKMKAIKLKVLKEARGNVYEEHKRFLNSFDASWRTDENIMLLLSAITLFTPERPNVAHKDVIKLEQISYYYLLRRYLEVIYADCEAQTVFVKLIHNIQWLHNLNENHVRVFMDLNPKDVEPLLIEIFDLKHC